MSTTNSKMNIKGILDLILSFKYEGKPVHFDNVARYSYSWNYVTNRLRSIADLTKKPHITFYADTSGRYTLNGQNFYSHKGFYIDTGDKKRIHVKEEYFHDVNTNFEMKGDDEIHTISFIKDWTIYTIRYAGSMWSVTEHTADEPDEHHFDINVDNYMSKLYRR